MRNALYRIVYFSRNLLSGPPEAQIAEINNILRVSQENNARVGVTGALLFNRGCFVQVLEGPRTIVEDIFERIAHDLRHTEVTVLEVSHLEKRDFPEWSMKYAGLIEDDRVTFATLAAASEAGAAQALRVLQDVCRREEQPQSVVG